MSLNVSKRTNILPAGQQQDKLLFITNLRRHGGRSRSLHPLVFGTAALSLLATALPSYAFAASMGSSNPSPPFIVGDNIIPSSSFFSSTSPFLPQHQQQLRYLSTSATFNSNNKQHCHSLFALRGGQSSRDNQYSSTSSPFAQLIKKVTVVGGTHGNEYTGIWVIKSIDKQREIYSQTQQPPNDGKIENDNDNIFEQFPSLEIDTLLANPVAYMENKRFIDVDLNREFSVEKLRKVTKSANADKDDGMEDCNIRIEFCSDRSVDNMGEFLASLPHESVRAREIEGLLGPKVILSEERPSTNDNDNDSSSSSFNNVDPNTCVVIDLHSTTSNMGITLIIPEGDALMSAAAAYVLHKCQERYGDHSAQCLMHALPQRQDRMNLSSCGRHGFTIEVGPTPQGVLRHDVVEKTQTALHTLLEFLHLRNVELMEQKNDDEKASTSLMSKLRELYPDGIVPCYRSAPAVRPGELSGKISWPNDGLNPNFPKWMIHKSVQDRDFEPLRVGDPLFVELDGTIVPYDGSHGDEVYLIFVNEGGYYYASSGTGIGVAVRSQFDLQTGWFVAESDDGEGGVEDVVVVVKDSYE